MTRSYTVVSVEDDIGLFDLIKLTLKPLPLKLYHAKSGEEALKLIPKVDADVLILDITLPDFHGWDLVKRLKMLDLNLKGIIVLTGRTDPAHRVMAHLHDVTAYLSKPFVPAELRDAIRQVLNLS